MKNNKTQPTVVDRLNGETVEKLWQLGQSLKAQQNEAMSEKKKNARLDRLFNEWRERLIL